MRISKVEISGLEFSEWASGLPMATSMEDVAPNPNRGTRLAQTPQGSGHDNFLKGITIHFYLQATNKFWVEMQRYHFVEIISSQSTMHKMSKFDLTNYNEYVDPRIIEIMKELQDTYNETRDKEDYMKLLYSNPAGFEIGAGLVTNYQSLKTIYKQRRNHRLQEWHTFCDWVETLPNAHWITGGTQ